MTQWIIVIIIKSLQGTWGCVEQEKSYSVHYLVAKYDKNEENKKISLFLLHRQIFITAVAIIADLANFSKKNGYLHVI